MRIIINESQFINLFEAVNLTDIHKKYYNTIPKDIFMKIISADPTYRVEKSQKMGKYGKWLLQLYLNRRLKVEDLYKATDYLRCFINYYNVIKDKDINKIKSLQELYEIVQPYLGGDIATSKSDEVRKIKEGAEKVYEDSEWLIIIPHTQEASCYYGKGTQWCTAAERSNNMFDHYNNQGPLYININKVNGKKYQFHFESNSFMDETDSAIDTPIAETINLSEGAINWYQENVDKGDEIIIKKYFFAFFGESEFFAFQRPNEEYWEIGDSEGYSVAKDLVLDGINKISYYRHQLERYGYAVIPNAYDLYSLIVLEDNELYLRGGFTSVKEVEGFDSDGEYSLLQTISKDGHFEVAYYPQGYPSLYGCNVEKINKVSMLNYNVLLISLKNGTYDIINVYSEEIVENLTNVELNEENYGDTLFITTREGETIEIDSETFEKVDYE